LSHLILIRAYDQASVSTLRRSATPADLGHRGGYVVFGDFPDPGP